MMHSARRPAKLRERLASLLAILFGYPVIQYFYLGKTAAGFIALGISILSCGAASVLWLIQGIMMIAMPEDEFERKFIYTDSTFPLF